MARRLRPNETEAANRGEITALLIRLGYQVYRPEADVDGVDLVLRSLDDALILVQLKSRLTVDWARYGNSNIWMLFPECPWKPNYVRRWFLVPHDVLFQLMEERHGHAPKWEKAWSVAKPHRDVLIFLQKYEVG